MRIGVKLQHILVPARFAAVGAFHLLQLRVGTGPIDSSSTGRVPVAGKERGAPLPGKERGQPAREGEGAASAAGSSLRAGCWHEQGRDHAAGRDPITSARTPEDPITVTDGNLQRRGRGRLVVLAWRHAIPVQCNKLH
jgi:hypothetical protein